jgi:hypothetical protein
MNIQFVEAMGMAMLRLEAEHRTQMTNAIFVCSQI